MTERVGATRAPLDELALRRALLWPRGPVTRLAVLPEVDSTNAELIAQVRADPLGWPHASILAADGQWAGRGRLGRSWVTPPRAAVMFSTLVRPGSVPLERWSWLPLLAGLAVRRALWHGCGIACELKWPNDVIVHSDGPDIDGWGRYRKLSGILAELIDDSGAGRPTAAVLGIGINAVQTDEELPVPWATSLALAGARVSRPETVLRAAARSVLHEVDAWIAADGDAEMSGLAEAVRRRCWTIGQPVRVETPDGAAITGTATDIDEQGQLVVRTDVGDLITVTAADVTRLRR